MYDFILDLPRKTKRRILFAADLVLVPVALLLAFALRYGMESPSSVVAQAWDVLLPVTILSGAIIRLTGLQRIKLQSFETRGIMSVGLASILLATAAMAVSYLMGAGTPRSVPLIFGSIFFVLSIGFRVSGMVLLTMIGDRSSSRVPVVIFGAGAAGIQLASALRQSREVRPVFFVDDNPNLHNLLVAGLPVRPHHELEAKAKAGKVARVLIALPSASKSTRQAVIERLSTLPCEVQALPSYVELIEGKNIADTLRPVSPDDLLGRDKVDLDIPDVARTYAGRSVMITGAGGSIGSELCRQLLDCRPARIVLYEHSEFALYQIDRDLRQRSGGASIEVVTRLGSVTDARRVREVIAAESVDIILHAAAYKHVPLVEENEVEGARNNSIGTHTVAEAAAEAGVERFILVSTDKAVRPTNIMGATKRIAEMVVQGLQARYPGTRLAMVRFGNVLGSSGSVIPLFQSQISSGGPVTVTHPDVTRFFMTIPEAARLVLLAGAYSEGGDVFVLDMGEPKKIIDIARRMIELSGHTVRENGNDGDIDIQITGLRPGEKLFEELLIAEDSLTSTPHEKILRANEDCLSEIEVEALLRKLRGALDAGDKEQVRAVVEAYVNGYHRPANLWTA